ncbi:MAG: hypothetical protein ABEI74_01825 [Candidatus Pacearchaeota archaeon]
MTERKTQKKETKEEQMARIERELAEADLVGPTPEEIEKSMEGMSRKEVYEKLPDYDNISDKARANYLEYIKEGMKKHPKLTSQKTKDSVKEVLGGIYLSMSVEEKGNNKKKLKNKAYKLLENTTNKKGMKILGDFYLTGKTLFDIEKKNEYEEATDEIKKLNLDNKSVRKNIEKSVENYSIANDLSTLVETGDRLRSCSEGMEYKKRQESLKLAYKAFELGKVHKGYLNSFGAIPAKNRISKIKRCYEGLGEGTKLKSIYKYEQNLNKDN